MRKQGRDKESDYLRETEIAVASRSEEKRKVEVERGKRERGLGARGKGGILEPGPALKYTPHEMPGVN